MSLITIPGVPQKNTFQNYSLNVADLIALVTQTYFQDQTNWKKIILTYVSSVSNQISLISFTPDELLTTLTAPGFFAEEARSAFQVSNITIYDKQNGRFRLERSQIPSVENYDLLFASGNAGATFFGINSALNNTSLSVDANDSNKLIYGFTDQSGLNAQAGLIIPLNLDTNGSFNFSIQQNLRDTNIQCFYANNDLTKAWVVGQFGTQLNGKSLPPVTVGPNYNNPCRIVEVDMVTGDVTWKVDLPNGGSGNYFSTSFLSIAVDESLNIAFVCDGGRLACYNLTTGNQNWFNYCSIVSSGYYESKAAARIYQDSSSIYMMFTHYKNIPVANSYQIYKLNKTDGERDTSLPDIPMTGADNSNFIYSMNQDCTKIVMGQQFSGYPGIRVFESGAWGSPLTIKTNPLHIFCTDTNIYVYGSVSDSALPYYQPGPAVIKFDYSGNYISIPAPYAQFSPFAPNPYTYAKMGVSNGKVYCTTSYGQIIQFNESTGLRVSSFEGMISNTQVQQLGNFTFYTGDKMIVDNFYNMSYYPSFSMAEQDVSYGIALIDINTRSIIHAQNINSVLQDQGIIPMTSTGAPNKMFLAGGSTLSVYDISTAPFTNETTGWPVRPGTGVGWSGSAMDQNYLYIAGGGLMNFNDAAGACTAYGLARINLSTKLVDRTFDMSGLTAMNGVQACMVFTTDNYIYLSQIQTFGGGGLPVMYRIKKSDGSIQLLDKAALGLTNDFYNAKANFVQIATNTIVMYLDKGQYNYYAGVGPTTTLDGRPYMILQEDTLTLTGTQIAADTSQTGFVLKYNAVNNTLGGVIRLASSGELRFAYYDLATAGRVLTSSRLDGSQPTDTNRFDVQNQTGYTSPMTVSGENYFMTCKSAVLGREVYNGILKMNPIGIINN